MPVRAEHGKDRRLREGRGWFGARPRRRRQFGSIFPCKIEGDSSLKLLRRGVTTRTPSQQVRLSNVGSVSEAGSSNGECMSSVSAFAKAAISVADNSAVCGVGASAFGAHRQGPMGRCAGSAAADADDLWQRLGGLLAGCLADASDWSSPPRPRSAALVET